MPYIDKEKVIERINYLCEVCSEPPMDKADEIRLNILRKLENEFNKLTTANVQEVKHGYWRREYKSGTSVENGMVSSCCDVWNERPTPFCPHCGAKMDGKEESK